MDGETDTSSSGSTPQMPYVRRRWALALGAIGVALVVVPAAFNMFTKAPKGAAMIAQFKPFMTTARLDGFQQDLRVINAGVQQADTGVAAALPGSPGTFDARFPTFSSFVQQWPEIDHTMTTLMDEVQSNQGNYEAVAALPSFRLFPWFFVIPGVLLCAVALGLLARPALWRRWRWVAIALGVGLIVAPAAFQMFARAPKGGQMMTAFKHIETTPNVEQIQGYFGNMAEGQGAIRLEIVPALERAGHTPAQIRSEFGAVATLDAQWVHILNDMTPMIGAMSDNVTNYQAVASLPPFPLFPWFFVFPGVIVAGLAIAGGSSSGSRQRVPATPPTQSVPTYQGAS